MQCCWFTQLKKSSILENFYHYIFSTLLSINQPSIAATRSQMESPHKVLGFHLIQKSAFLKLWFTLKVVSHPFPEVGYSIHYSSAGILVLVMPVSLTSKLPSALQWFKIKKWQQPSNASHIRLLLSQMVKTSEERKHWYCSCKIPLDNIIAPIPHLYWNSHC